MTAELASTRGSSLQGSSALQCGTQAPCLGPSSWLGRGRRGSALSSASFCAKLTSSRYKRHVARQRTWTPCRAPTSTVGRLDERIGGTTSEGGVLIAMRRDLFDRTVEEKTQVYRLGCAITWSIQSESWTHTRHITPVHLDLAPPAALEDSLVGGHTCRVARAATFSLGIGTLCAPERPGSQSLEQSYRRQTTFRRSSTRASPTTRS